MMRQALSNLNSLSLSLSFIVYACFSWAVISFFKATTNGSARGKRLISVAGTTSILFSLYFDYSQPTTQPIRIYLSVCLFATALIFFWWTIFSVRNVPMDIAFSRRSPQKIVMQGPYRIVRHPFYFSYFCAWMAASFATANYFEFLVPCAMEVIYFLAARQEERLISIGALGSTYQEYKETTAMLIPFVKL